MGVRLRRDGRESTELWQNIYPSHPSRIRGAAGALIDASKYLSSGNADD
jgi:hypothetical protein